MKTPLVTLALFACVLFRSDSTLAAVIASDSFNYTIGSNLGGASGGAGWAGAWSTGLSGGAVVTIETDPVTGSASARFVNGTTLANDSFAFRQLSAAFTGDILYSSYTLKLGQAPTADFFAQWLDTVATGNHSSSRLNAGLFTTDNLFARLNSGGTTVQTSFDAEVATTYQIVTALSKSTLGAGNPFNTLRFWINPSSGDLGTPLGSVTLTTSSSISYLGFRGAANENLNTYWVDNVTLATTWGDVVPVPEPSALGMFATGFTALVLMRGERRKAVS